MKTVIRFCATFVFYIFYRPDFLMAQDGGGSDIDNLEVLDSSFMEIVFIPNAVTQNTVSGNTKIIILLSLVAVVALACLIFKKKIWA